ncbi:MAG: ATP-binding cassette domain-containing protein [bacterium]
MIAVEHLSIRVGNFELKDMSFSVQKGEYFVILGLSGVGKTLLLETIAGLVKPLSGTINLRGSDVTSGRIQSRNISIVYQDADLFPHLSVYDNIAYPLRCRKRTPVEPRVLDAARRTGIADKMERFPESLSGGEYQRAALARSLAADSDIFLLDEPLSSLDAPSKIELRSLLRKLNRQGITIIHVTHDYEEAVSLATKIGIMENGRLTHVASPEEIFKHPKSEFIARFVGIKNYLRGFVKSIQGSDLKQFSSNGISLFCLTEISDGEAFLTIRPDEISIANRKERSSSRNHFKGTITDIAQAALGLELTIDIGIELVIMISSDARRALHLEIGKAVWISFKASSCKVYN